MSRPPLQLAGIYASQRQKAMERLNIILADLDAQFGKSLPADVGTATAATAASAAGTPASPAPKTAAVPLARMLSTDTVASGDDEGGHEAAEEARTIWVGGLPAAVASAAAAAGGGGGGALAALFGRYGAVVSVSCRVKVRAHRRPTGFVATCAVVAVPLYQPACCCV